MPILEAKNISKKYDNLLVINSLSLAINTAEIVSIVGASGAGKSTLLHILGTLDKPDTGDILIDSISISELSTPNLARFRNEKIGFVFQFHNLLPEFTALENVCMPAYLGKKNKKDIIQRATFLLELLGLSNRKTHLPAQLSGGEQQRVAVARALINEPAIVFADEPSGNLDSTNAKELHALFFLLRQELSQTFVVVTHNEELANLADRRLLMKDGKI